MNEELNAKPEHYRLNVEPIDLIESVGMLDDFCAGNVIKYIARYKQKDGIADLVKARWYLNKLIETVKNAPNRPSNRR